MAALAKEGYLVQSLRNSDFDCYSAYGEVIDNSVQAEAKKINIRFNTVKANRNEVISEIVFADDGQGMSTEILENCLTLGYSSRFNERDGIGRFGVGATLAAINQCKNIKVFSKVKGSDWYSVQAIVADDPEEQEGISSPIKENIPDQYKDLIGDSSGTLVIWADHDRNSENAENIIEETKIWVGRTFRKFIWQGISFTINGELVYAIDPLYLNNEKTKFPDDPIAKEQPTILIDWPISNTNSSNSTSDEILIKLSLLPEKLRPYQGVGGTKETRDRHIHLNEGISIMRNNREVFHGIPPFWPSGIFKGTDNTINRWWGCEISFNAVHDESFTVKNIKRGAVPVLNLKKAIHDKIQPTIVTMINEVQDVWKKWAADKLIEENENGMNTGHEDAEKIAKQANTSKNILTENEKSSDLVQSASDKLLSDKQKQDVAAWRAKFEAQPFTILDGEWPGKEFVQLTHTVTGAVMKYNLRHNLHQDIAEIVQNMENSSDPEILIENSRKLKIILDLILMAYCKAEGTFSKDQEYKAEDLIEDLRLNWGRFLENYLKKLPEK